MSNESAVVSGRFAVRLLCAVLIGPLFALPDVGRAEPRIEVVTIGPDRALDTRFGHSVLRVVDADSGRDDAYDFGATDLEPPAFIAAAAMGRARFRLQRSSAQIRFERAVAADRQTESQRLDLTDEQIATLIERLEWNLMPENAVYAYDDVTDNCAIRLRDLLDHATGGAAQRAAYDARTSRTYRDEILAAGSGRTSALVAYDLFAGPRADDQVRAWQLSFAPNRLRDVLRSAENPALAAGVSLVASDRVLHRRKGPTVVGGSVRRGREIVAGIGAALGLLFGLSGYAGFASWGNRRNIAWLSRLAGLMLIPTAALLGVLGLALLPISLFSTATIWAGNQNAWLFFPLDVLLLAPAVRWLFTGRATLASWTRIYIDLRFLMVAIGWSGVVATQENTAFGLAVVLTLAGLRTQPLKGARVRDPDLSNSPAP